MSLGLRIKGYGLRLLAITAILLTAVSSAGAVSSKELIDKANEFDGQSVKYRGEAVTAILHRSGGSWVNVNDGEKAIGVWCGPGMTDCIKRLGDYKTKGDTLEIEGKFHRACPQHGGELDIHAESLIVIKPGYIEKEHFEINKVNISAAIFMAAMLLIVLFRKRF